MIYRVVMDGNDILDFEKHELVLISPSLKMEVSTAGSFEFTMPPGHYFYDDIHILTSLVEVYEGDELLWFGRPVDIKTDFYKQKKVYCEGALAFFNDSIQRLAEYDTISVRTFFSTVIANHNAQVESAKQFTVGTVTVPDKTVYRKLNYNNTFEVLKKQCLDAEGGYFFIRRENGVNYIDWLTEMPYTCNQPVEFGLNLLNMSSDLDASSLATCVIPLGDNVEETGLPLTVSSVNGGSDMITSEAVSTYGYITKAVTFSGVSDASTLYTEGTAYLESTQFDDLVIECSAAELHYRNENYEQFRLGQTILCHSIPHLLNKSFPLVKISIQLDTAAKQITLGTVRRQALTEIYKNGSEVSKEDIDTAVSEAVEAAVPPAVGEAVQEAVGEAVQEAVGEGLSEIVTEQATAIIDDTVPGLVEAAVGETINSAAAVAVDTVIQGADATPISGSTNIVTSDGIYEALHDIDDTPTEDSAKPISSGAVYDALATDSTPTEGSTNLITSGAVHDALATDDTPTEGSNNLITSGAVYDALSNISPGGGGGSSGDGWVHQIDGVTQTSGTINFIAVEEA